MTRCRPKGRGREDNRSRMVKTIIVKELMVPLSEYATVSEEATMQEAVLELERAQKAFDPKRHRHRAILVLGKDGNVVGKISQLDVLRSLEPRYKDMGADEHLSRAGFSQEFLKDMLDKFSLWQEPLTDICRKAAKIGVKNIMYTPSEDEYVDEETTLNEAIHRMIMGHHHSLLVTRGDEIAGVLRLVDLFAEVCERIKSCEL